MGLVLLAVEFIKNLPSLSRMADYTMIMERRLSEVTCRSMYLSAEVGATATKLTDFAKKLHQVL